MNDAIFEKRPPWPVFYWVMKPLPLGGIFTVFKSRMTDFAELARRIRQT
jgi:hypothetical protein